MTNQSNILATARRFIVPFFVILGFGYFNYALNYSLGYNEIYKHHSHASAIVLWCLTGFCEFCVLIYWALILYVGPGISPKFPQWNLFQNSELENELLPTPDIFFCDEFGYPYYDSHTQSMKIDRSFYSKYFEHVILKYDHHCLWVGTSIGLTNYLYFLKFCFWFLALFIIMLIYSAKYTRSTIARGEINHNLIPIFIACGLWIPMIAGLLVTHIRYVCLNMTTLDDITLNQRNRYRRYKDRKKQKSSPICPQPRKPRKENGDRYVSVKKEDFRLIIKFDIKERPFDMGFKKNWINLIFNGNRNNGKSDDYYTTKKFVYGLIIFMCPFVELPLEFQQRRRIHYDPEMNFKPIDNIKAEYDYYSSDLSPQFLKMIQMKIDKKDCYIPSYLNYKE
ncbi:PFA5 [Candida pseudojiufengensis]|uniref:PFA5 n=1 Tax=Candida pseudojiufengensis TaxID=497109 RepID=UPI0022250235|nr:PFA5 [Candida pseudojiufengensis]KAI5964113.1 PFA5 [Candida pseudojiufengensis]